MILKEKLPINEYKIFINKLADIASQISLQYFRNINNYNIKNDSSLVTIADKEVELALRKEINKQYPEHNIFAEEYENEEIKSDYVWYIDPIDGTHAFIAGKPSFTNLIALAYKNIPILSVINQPFTNERWQASYDENTTLNGKVINSSNKSDIKDSIISTTSPYLFSEKGEKIISNVKNILAYQKSGGINFGGDAYQYGLLALGNIDLIIEENLKPYDFVALIPIVSSSGGVITNWEGEEVNINSNSNILASASKKLHKKTLDIIKQI